MSTWTSPAMTAAATAAIADRVLGDPRTVDEAVEFWTRARALAASGRTAYGAPIVTAIEAAELAGGRDRARRLTAQLVAAGLMAPRAGGVTWRVLDYPQQRGEPECSPT